MASVGTVIFVIVALIYVMSARGAPALDGVPMLACIEADCFEGPEGPICAVDATGVARTFYNWCHMIVISCKQNTHFAVVGEGEC